MLRSVRKYLRNSKSWRKKMTRRSGRLIRKLKRRGLSDRDILDFFIYDNLIHSEKRFCPLFASGQKCHIFSADRLNCLGCYCPYFELTVEEKGSEIECGSCSVNSPAAQRFSSDGKVKILDCSMCVIPHQASTAMKVLRSYKDSSSRD